MSNSRLNLVSSKELIGEFLLDYDVQATNFISSLNRFIVRGIELMDIDTFYSRCTSKMTIIDNRAILPCRAKYIEAIFINLNGCPYLLDLSNNNLTLLENVISDVDLYSDAYIEDRTLNLKRYEGEALIIYKTLPKDKEGYVKIPDDAWLKEALLMFLISKMSLSGYRHKVISRQEAEQKWNALYPRARNSVNFPTVQEIQSFTEMWNNPLKGDWYNNLFS